MPIPEHKRRRRRITGASLMALAWSVATAALALITLSHLRPPLHPFVLLHLADVCVASGFVLFFLSFYFFGLKHVATPAQWSCDMAKTRWPWFDWLRKGLFLLAVIEFLLAGGFGVIFFEHGKWFGSNRLVHHFPIPKSVAINGLWRDVRAGSSCVLCIVTAWMSNALGLIYESLVSRDKNEK